jgi:hypothetical protein
MQRKLILSLCKPLLSKGKVTSLSVVLEKPLCQGLNKGECKERLDKFI